MKKILASLSKVRWYGLNIVALIYLIPFVTFAVLSPDNPLTDLLTRAGLFIQKILIPLLFGIAFLSFLINMVRYFILGANNEESLKKAKRNTLYSLAAFIFLISIWAIVSMVLGGLQLTRNEVICPDYNPNCSSGIAKGGIGGNKFGGTTFPNPVGGGTGGSGGGGTGGSGGGGTGGDSGNGDGSVDKNDPNFSGLAELIFGTGKDSAVFTRYKGGPRAIYQTPTIATNATCSSGLRTLTLANRTETAQAAYVLYKNTAGVTRWKNITDLNSTNHIAYDKDTLNALLKQNVSDVYIIHTHPDTRTKSLGLSTQGHAPSTADFKSMCSNNQTNLSYGVVDRTGIWTITPQSDTCPYTPNASNILPVIETYADLGVLEASTRQIELLRYTDSSITPPQYKNHFSRIDSEQLSSLTIQEVIALSNYYQTYASTTVTYQENTDDFCNTFLMPTTP